MPAAAVIMPTTKTSSGSKSLSRDDDDDETADASSRPKNGGNDADDDRRNRNAVEKQSNNNNDGGAKGQIAAGKDDAVVGCSNGGSNASRQQKDDRSKAPMAPPPAPPPPPPKTESKESGPDPKQQQEPPRRQPEGGGSSKLADASREEMVLLSGRESKRKRKAATSSFCMVDVDSAMTPKKKKKKEDAADNNKKMPRCAEKEFEDSWICCECKEAECMIKPDAEELMICEGPCLRVFHYPCAGLSELPGEDETYVCEDCQNKRHVCSICQQYGVDEEDVFPCSREGCGLFFHESCLSMLNVEVRIVPYDKGSGGGARPSTRTASSSVCSSSNADLEEAAEQESTAATTAATTTTTTTTTNDNASSIGENDDKLSSTFFATTGRRQFSCPAHWCWTCKQTDMQAKEKKRQQQEKDNDAAASTKKKGGRKKKKKAPSAFAYKSEIRLLRCMECCTSYHLSCIPPTARFHELAMLCHEHSASYKLPDLDLETSVQGSIEKAIDDKFFQLEEQRRRRASGGDRGGGGRRRRRKRDSGGDDTSEGEREPDNPFFPGMTGNKRTRQEELLQKEIEKELQRRRSGKRAAPPLPPPPPVASGEDLWFCLPCEVKDEVHSKPPSYRHIHSNRYDPKHKPPRIPPSGDVCQCRDRCDENCINRMDYVECFGRPPGDNKNTTGGGRSTNCCVGPSCGNRRLLHRKFPKCKPKRERGRGWGLVTQEDIAKGDLVQEYVGEVIDASTKEKRLIEWTAEHPNDPNFYIMSLQTGGWFVDARHESNLARFINHSCRPNCVLISFNVGGYMRNGIWALRDIREGEFLSYDYHFDTRHGDRFVCRCGSPECRGTMKGNNSTVDFSGPGGFELKSTKRAAAAAAAAASSLVNGESLSPAEAAAASRTRRWDEARAKYDRDRKFVADYYSRQDEGRLSQVAATVPGSDCLNELVANGPHERNRELSRRTRTFLWRNAVAGSDFADRFARLEKRDWKTSREGKSEKRSAKEKT